MIRVTSAVGTVMDSLVYSVTDDFGVDYYLIDIGDFEAAIGLLPPNAKVKGVFITHGHHDHILGLNKLKVRYPDCIVYASNECVRMLATAKDNLSAYLEIPFVYEGEVTILRDGEMVVLFEDTVLTAIATPGHNPSCMSFMVEDFLFTGDSYIPGVKVVTNLPGGSKKQAQETVEKILSIGQGKIICPGHKTD